MVLRQARGHCNHCRPYLVMTWVICRSGYAWFHWAEMFSKVRRKGLIWPGASGDRVRSTASSYRPPVRSTCRHIREFQVRGIGWRCGGLFLLGAKNEGENPDYNPDDDDPDEDRTQ